MISKAEYQEWLDHPVTEAFMQTIKDCTEDVLHRLVNNTEAEVPDAWFKGYLIALKDVTSFSVEDVE